MERLLFRAGHALVRRTVTRSRSKKGYHVYLVIEPPCENALEMVALQSVLGSDPYREACNTARARILDKVPEFWRHRWNVFYDPRWPEGFAP